MKRITNTILLSISAFVFASVGLFAQADAFTVKFGGFVKTDAFYDTRQMQSIREGHVSTFPAPVVLDSSSSPEDINDRGNFNILSVQTRITTKVEGPGLFGGKTSGYVEAEYLGSTDATINSLRLRHAIVDLDFDNFQIRAGQYWHPLFATDNFPEVISFNTGIPFIPFNRSPQIKVTGKFGNFKPYLALLSQRDFASEGPKGASPLYLRNSGIPEIALGFGYSSPELSFGLGGATKSILPNPELVLGSDSFKNDDQLRTYTGSAYFRTKMDKFHIKLQGNYAQNNSEFLMIGGYAVKSQDNVNSKYEYTPITSVSGWLELMYKDEWEFASVFGLAQNLGAADKFTGAAYGRGLDIDKIIKVYPRIAYNFNKTKIGIEAEYSSAFYGTKISKDNQKVENAEAVNNLRILLAFYVFF